MIRLPIELNVRGLARLLGQVASTSLARFLAVGSTGLAVDMAAFTALHEAGLSQAAARAVSMMLATLTTWTLNRRFTFAQTGRPKRFEIGRYVAVVLIAQGFSYCAFLTIAALTPGLPPQLALVTGAVLATGLSFCGQRFFTFAGSMRTQEIAQ